MMTTIIEATIEDVVFVCEPLRDRPDDLREVVGAAVFRESRESTYGWRYDLGLETCDGEPVVVAAFQFLDQVGIVRIRGKAKERWPEVLRALDAARPDWGDELVAVTDLWEP